MGRTSCIPNPLRGIANKAMFCRKSRICPNAMLKCQIRVICNYLQGKRSNLRWEYEENAYRKSYRRVITKTTAGIRNSGSVSQMPNCLWEKSYTSYSTGGCRNWKLKLFVERYKAIV